MDNLKSSQILRKNGSPLNIWQENIELIGLYFTASWCPPCRAFTPILNNVYKEWKSKGKNIEILFVSCDQDSAADSNYYQNMDFPRIAFGDANIGPLNQNFMISGIPHLVIIDSNGVVKCQNARDDVKTKGSSCIDQWHSSGAQPMLPPTLEIMDVNATPNFEYPDMPGQSYITTGVPVDKPQKEMAKPGGGALGHVYVQQGTVGVASYHFGNVASDSYISYQNAPNSWRLKDGSKPPSKKYFENASYDEKNRIFKGDIIWGKNTFGNNTKWEYEMIFSEDFSIIKIGTCKMYGVEGNIDNIMVFNKDLKYTRYSTNTQSSPKKELAKPVATQQEYIDVNKVEFRAVKSNDSLPSGWTNATWKYILKNDAYLRASEGSGRNTGNKGTSELMPNAVKAVSGICWGIIKVENGSLDGPGYDNRWRFKDDRGMGHKLIMKLK